MFAQSSGGGRAAVKAGSSPPTVSSYRGRVVVLRGAVFFFVVLDFRAALVRFRFVVARFFVAFPLAAVVVECVAVEWRAR